MSTENIFGSWDFPPKGNADHLSALWHILAAQNVGTANFIPNFGLSQRRAEIEMLWHLYEKAKPQIVVEIGVAQAGTFAAWCILGRADATIIGIDRCLDDSRPRPGDPVHPSIHPGPYAMYSQGGGILHLAQRRQKVIGINGWSLEASTLSQLNEVLQGRTIDWLFNDGSHEASMAQGDFENYWPLISEGGVYATHDICRSDDPKCNKKEWWDHAVATADYSAVFEFKPSRNEQNMGIGLFVK